MSRGREEGQAGVGGWGELWKGEGFCFPEVAGNNNNSNIVIILLVHTEHSTVLYVSTVCTVQYSNI